MTKRRNAVAAGLALGLAVIAAASCSGSKGSAGPDPGAGGAGGQNAPFEPLTIAAAGTKVKTLMVGLALTPDEVAALQKDPNALRGLIDQWMKLPAWRTRLMGFFQQAFQQTQVGALDYDDQTGLKISNFPTGTLIARSAEESFARTVLQLLDEGRPFNEVVTTRRFMLNPPLMALLAYMDAMPQDDAGNPLPAASWLFKKYPKLQLVGDTTGPIPWAETIDPASPNFMKYYYNPTAAVAAKPQCTTAPGAQGYKAIFSVAELMFGKNPGVCGAVPPAFTADDWDDWRMVTVRAPTAGEERTVFWDVAGLRAAPALVLGTPRVGFMTTPAFFANWMTNDSNQMRVTTNQALIVGLGTSFDDRNTTVRVSETTSDAAHVQPGTTCYGCHKTLDPMRDFFRQSYNYYYSEQQPAIATADMVPATATFSVTDGAPVTGNGIGDLAAAMAANERFPIAWAQKLCRLANSASCTESDPEFVRVATAFKDSHFDFATLVREMFSSPLVTFTSSTQSAVDNGIVIGIQRRETLCASLASRLGVGDVCALHGTTGLKGTAAAAARVASNLAGAVPGDGYARGSEVPLMPHDPSLFFVSALDNLCGNLAAQLVDSGAAAKFTSANKDQALASLVTDLMGVPATDPRFADLQGALAAHNDAAVAAGETPSDALKSTFVLACTAPTTVSSGL